MTITFGSLIYPKYSFIIKENKIAGIVVDGISIVKKLAVLLGE
ncbi:MAG TPA: hypothetical protein ACFYD6_11340 [Candidatus Brocadiia bacterium]